MSAKMKIISCSALLLTLVVLPIGTASAVELRQSLFDRELQKIRYDVAGRSAGEQPYLAFTDEDDDVMLLDLAQAEAPPPEYKSPGRAFLYSLVVPGLGQFYYGSRIKPFLFLAVEAVGWKYALQYHADGEDITAEFRAFNNEHWLRDVYSDYLLTAYGTLQPDTLEASADRKGYTHTLPEARGQQYYEMTGKYNQFAWGWDDATLNDMDWEIFKQSNPSDWDFRILSDKSTPVSANRLEYEGMRDAANQEYSKSMKFVFGIMANHLISAFEAYFVTKSHNKKLRYEQEFARLKVNARLRSYSSWQDTPYVTFTYTF
ncbi:MAG: hypothetical protein KAW91_00395 [candidate division Zixibacteria bacterium]|nr:hypothetical protein [candidate division Zixibacteria bacterium]